MTDEQVLYKAIIKAEKSGYKGHMQYLPLFLKRDTIHKKRMTKKKFMLLMSRVWYSRINDIIFDIEFAKAFFGEQMFAYRTCLQDMSVEEDRIEYIKKFL